MRVIFASILLVAAAACGGKSTPAPSEPTEEAKPEEHHVGEHPELPAELTAFHDVLAPLWHAEAGAQRETDTCAAVPAMQEKAAAIAAAPPPGDVDAALWGKQSDVLAGSVDMLGAGCGSGEQHDFDGEFGAVHDAFHGLLDLLPKEAA
jgi:hypothetical protein